MYVELHSTTTFQIVLVTINNHSSFKLNGTNYPTWKVKFNPLLVGYDLVSYVDNTETCLLGVSAALRTRENPIAFEELHDVLYDYENYLNPY